jgi:Contact-dependent growth inhibition CdiA C-terminal domain
VNPCRIDGNNALGADSLSGPPDDPGFPRREIRTHDARQSTGHESEDPAEGRSRQEYREILRSAQAGEAESFGSLFAARPAVERVEWQTALMQAAVDRNGRGVIDERAKRFSPAERRIAEILASRGPAVVAVSEGFGASGRTPDAHVNGVPVEFKSLDPGASDRTVKAALNSAKGQARHAVIDARDSGLAEDDALRGIRRFRGTPHGDRIHAILILGDNFTIEWKRAE